MRRVGTVLCLIVSVILIVTGVCDHQFQTVMAKAAKICLECIGIG